MMPNEQDLIWVEEAKIVYKHAREWFMRRVDDGRLHKVLLPGSTRVYLVKSELEQYMKDHDTERE
jgi:hypothetical protein